MGPCRTVAYDCHLSGPVDGDILLALPSPSLRAKSLVVGLLAQHLRAIFSLWVRLVGVLWSEAAAA